MNCGWSYIDPPDHIKKTTNPINKEDNKCFQYVTTFALNHKEIGRNSGRISKIKLFIDKYNWEGIIYRSGKGYWKKKVVCGNDYFCGVGMPSKESILEFN